MSEQPRDGTDVAKIVVVSIGVLLTAAIIGIIVWSTTSGSAPPDISSRVLAVEIVDDRQLRATIEVEKAPLASAECDVSALDEDGGNVGRLIGVVFGPNTANQRVTTVSVAVQTPLGRAASAHIATCRITRTR